LFVPSPTSGTLIRASVRCVFASTVIGSRI